ncbi:hypothetical protein GPECTOR_48g420 [Gonium pectorale]|uniref:SRCR domain-containing protein n=1 Tax=Gonium pectorale TaxID=33097 RepID=A0A150G842_GONPE|nr:hypothetical protein GPECTOR_48g420 [Gonium pectorale]|eukprot:KXZ45988.1 hypothetical protein GPECTOR_48g420 [Gonium pectorale]
MDLPPATGTLRLTGGPIPSAGRLEVAYRNEWGSVSGMGVGWGGKESAVACRQMGYPGVTSYWTSNEPSHPNWISAMDDLTRSRMIFLYNVSCLGNETSLARSSMMTIAGAP